MSWLLRIDAPADPEGVTALLWSLGTTGVAEVDEEGTTRLLAGFETAEDAHRAAAGITETTIEVVPVDPEAWVVPDPVEICAGGRTITIEVGRAFGHGGHDTTALALDAVERLVRPGDRVLDVGTGTGILALAARAWGAGHVTAIDIDPAAVAQARTNAQANDLAIEVGDTDLASLAPGSFDLVVANMLLADLRSIGPAIGRLPSVHGRLFVTGILDEQADRAAALFPSLTEAERAHRHGWTGLTLTGAQP